MQLYSAIDFSSVFVRHCIMNWLALAISLLIILGVLFANKKEMFGVPEFLDRSNTRRDSKSSYAQVTNHAAAPSEGPPPRGEPTGHRVGQWEGHNAPF